MSKAIESAENGGPAAIWIGVPGGVCKIARSTRRSETTRCYRVGAQCWVSLERDLGWSLLAYGGGSHPEEYGGGYHETVEPSPCRKLLPLDAAGSDKEGDEYACQPVIDT